MGKRVALVGPEAGDDPDEIWIECEDCEGTKTVDIPDEEDETLTVVAQCPGCDGLGFYAGDADDVDS